MINLNSCDRSESDHQYFFILCIFFRDRRVLLYSRLPVKEVAQRGPPRCFDENHKRPHFPERGEESTQIEDVSNLVIKASFNIFHDTL